MQLTTPVENLVKWQKNKVRKLKIMKEILIRKIHKNAANIISILGLLLGFGAFMNVHTNLELSLKLIIIATILDQFDGRIARYLKIQSETGKHIDSFVDLINFGLFAPFILVMAYGRVDVYSMSMVFIFTSCALLRLARFNLQHDDSVFHGIPVPCAAILVIMPAIFEFKLNIEINLLTVILTILPISFGMLVKTKTVSIKKMKLGFNYFSFFALILILLIAYDVLLAAIIFGMSYILTIVYSVFNEFNAHRLEK